MKKTYFKNFPPDQLGESKLNCISDFQTQNDELQGTSSTEQWNGRKGEIWIRENFGVWILKEEDNVGKIEAKGDGSKKES